MASDMWDAARQLQGASFYASAATATGGELQEYLLKSTYGRELDASTVRGILERLRQLQKERDGG